MPPKRRAPSTNDIGDAQQIPSKRARFADPDEEDDAGRFAEEVDASLDMAGKTTRKGGVKVEGYESDSTDDGEGVVFSRRPGNDEEDEDMFAMGSNDPDKAAKADSSSKKKDTKYLKLGEIEGQEFDEAEAGEGNNYNSDDASSSEPEDEDDAERRKKVGMGYEMTKFNMKEEMEEGKFAEDGMYVRSFDPAARHDRWLENVDEREMKKARKAKRKAERVERERIREEEQAGNAANAANSKAEMEKELVCFLKPSETVLEALARLGKEKKSAQKGNKNVKGETNAKIDKKASDIARVTTLASLLMVSDPDIYSTAYEVLLRGVRRAGVVPQDWTPPVTKYEYRWAAEAGSGDTNTVHGPFTADEVQSWYDASFFGFTGEKIKIRTMGSSEWLNWDDLFV